MAELVSPLLPNHRWAMPHFAKRRLLKAAHRRENRRPPTASSHRLTTTTTRVRLRMSRLWNTRCCVAFGHCRACCSCALWRQRWWWWWRWSRCCCSRHGHRVLVLGKGAEAANGSAVHTRRQRAAEAAHGVLASGTHFHLCAAREHGLSARTGWRCRWRGRWRGRA